jgi:hypothetical protein
VAWRAVIKHGRRMAGRNNLYIFAWLCAVVLPAVLQWLSGQVVEVRDYLGSYYGWFSLYMFFALTYGFGVVFVAYYQVSGYHKAGTLDLLRVSGIRPREVLSGVFLQLQMILIPPLLGFALVLVGYSLVVSLLSLTQEQPLAGLGGGLVVGGAAVMLFNQALLCAWQLLGLYRREAPFALASAVVLVPLLNAGPVIAFMVLHVPIPVYILMMLVLLGLLLWVGEFSLARMWPAQVAVRKGV